MRKIILSCLLLGISLTTYAQTSLFDLWQEASEHVNIYTYGLKKINKDTIYRPDNYRPNMGRVFRCTKEYSRSSTVRCDNATS